MFFGGGDPFEHFAHGGGGGGGGGSRRSGRSSAAVDTNKLYETLGVSSEKMCIVLYYIDLSFFKRWTCNRVSQVAKEKYYDKAA